MQMTPKETALLKDMKDQEKLCIDKYTKHSSAAVDTQLKDLFSQFAATEQRHYDALTQLENGTVPQFNGSGQSAPAFNAVYTCSETPDKKNDCYLCTDALAIEKHASHLYDTCIFEFKDQGVRTVLNQIQTQEQSHGKQLYDYMNVNCMYS